MNRPASEPASFETMRHAMVASQLRTTGVDDARLVAAMDRVPREAFVPPASRALAYRDTAIELGGGRRMNAPMATARLLTVAQVAAGDRVLLVGAGGGYAAAVLAALGAEVTALERDAALVGAARVALAGSGVTLVEGPLAAGWPDGAPYDAIVIDGAVERVPDALADQLVVGGRLATGLVDRGVTRLASGRRSAGGFGVTAFADVDCAILPGFERPRGFAF